MKHCVDVSACGVGSTSSAYAVDEKQKEQTLGSGAARVQLATYPQSPFSGPVRCCDVTDLYQAFSQPTGPGRLWISLGTALLVCCSSWMGSHLPKHTTKGELQSKLSGTP